MEMQAIELSLFHWEIIIVQVLLSSWFTVLFWVWLLTFWNQAVDFAYTKVKRRHSSADVSILVITVAHNPLCASRVPVYTNQCKHSWSIIKLHFLNNLKGNFSTLGNYVYFKVRDNDNTFWWENYFIIWHF